MKHLIISFDNLNRRGKKGFDLFMYNFGKWFISTFLLYAWALPATKEIKFSNIPAWGYCIFAVAYLFCVTGCIADILRKTKKPG